MANSDSGYLPTNPTGQELEQPLMRRALTITNETGYQVTWRQSPGGGLWASDGTVIPASTLLDKIWSFVDA